MERLAVMKMTRKCVVINGERIYFDEPFKRAPSKDKFEQWLQNIKIILEEVFATANK